MKNHLKKFAVVFVALMAGLAFWVMNWDPVQPTEITVVFAKPLPNGGDLWVSTPTSNEDWYPGSIPIEPGAQSVTFTVKVKPGDVIRLNGYIMVDGQQSWLVMNDGPAIVSDISDVQFEDQSSTKLTIIQNESGDADAIVPVP